MLCHVASKEWFNSPQSFRENLSRNSQLDTGIYDKWIVIFKVDLRNIRILGYHSGTTLCNIASNTVEKLHIRICGEQNDTQIEDATLHDDGRGIVYLA